MSPRQAIPRYVFSVPAHAGISDVLRLKRYDRLCAGGELPPHVHDRRILEVLYLARGQQAYVIGGQRFTMSGGDVLVIHPGESHSSGGAPQAKCLLYWLQLRIPRRGQAFLGLSHAQSRTLLDALLGVQPRLFPGAPTLQQHLDEAIRLLLAHRGTEAGTEPSHMHSPHGRPSVYSRGLSPLASISVQGRVAFFLVEAINCARRHHAQCEHPWRTRVLAYLDGHIAEPLSIAALAAHLGVSRTWFSTRFRQELGMPPAQFFLQRKVERAREALLRAPERPVTQVALDFGFSSSQYFATVFRRYLGVAPRDLRRPRA
jgi:AraC-like DNA-binding protein